MGWRMMGSRTSWLAVPQVGQADQADDQHVLVFRSQPLQQTGTKELLLWIQILLSSCLLVQWALSSWKSNLA